MISAAPAPDTVKAAYSCGPVQLVIEFDDVSLRDALHGLLSQYDAPWETQACTIRVSIEREKSFAKNSEPSGTYLRSYRLRVDRDGSRLFSLSEVGVWMEFEMNSGHAHIVLPDHPDWPTVVEEVEQQFVLLLARAWAQTGWTPLHAGTLISPDGHRCALLCAPSGTGKSTLTAAMLGRGWRTLGDDKTLLRQENRQVTASALAWRFHLHPASSRWLSEAGDIRKWPTYSRWTEKRVVRASEIWPEQLIGSAIPAAIVRLERTESGLTIEPLDRVNAMKVLVNQVAIPSDAEHARPLVSCIASVATNAKAALIKIGNDAFSDPTIVARLENSLRELLQ
jgi:hypothetical protein